MSTRRRIEPWPVALAALLLAMMGTSLGFYRVASRHPDPLVVADAYRAGRSFSDRVRAARRAEALGWEIALAAQPRPGAARLEVTLRDRDGLALAPDAVRLRRERPAEGGLDAWFALTERDGRFVGEVELPRPGRWHLVVRAERGEDAAERGFDLWLP